MVVVIVTLMEVRWLRTRQSSSQAKGRALTISRVYIPVRDLCVGKCEHRFQLLEARVAPTESRVLEMQESHGDGERCDGREAARRAGQAGVCAPRGAAPGRLGLGRSWAAVQTWRPRVPRKGGVEQTLISLPALSPAAASLSAASRLLGMA